MAAMSPIGTCSRPHKKHSAVDVFVNSAGIMQMAPIAESSLAYRSRHRHQPAR